MLIECRLRNYKDADLEYIVKRNRDTDWEHIVKKGLQVVIFSMESKADQLSGIMTAIRMTLLGILMTWKIAAGLVTIFSF